MSRYIVWAAAFVSAIALSGATSWLLSSGGSRQTATVVAQPIETPPYAEEGPIVRNDKQADLDLSMVISPGVAGSNVLNFYMIDVDRDWKDVERFTVRFVYLEEEGAQAYDLVQLHEGHFPREQLELKYAGRWRAEVSVLRAEVGEQRFTFEFVLSHP